MIHIATFRVVVVLESSPTGHLLPDPCGYLLRISGVALRDHQTQLYQFTDNEIGLLFKMADQVHIENSPFLPVKNCKKMLT